MQENMLVGSHKVSNPMFDKGYDYMVWESDTKELKREKRKKQALTSKKVQRRADR
jgi:hypothetical protein